MLLSSCVVCQHQTLLTQFAVVGIGWDWAMERLLTVVTAN